jgi:thiamine kinase-like enzyme
MQLGIPTHKGRSFATIGERVMTEEDEAFNEIERRSIAKKDAVMAALENAEIRVTELKKRLDVLNASRNDTINEVLQLIKELRPAIMPLEGMGRGKATQEWFDILAKHIEEMKK